MDAGERDALLTLMLTSGLGHGLVGRCVEAFGSAQATLGAAAKELAQVRGVSRDSAAGFRADFDAIRGDGRLERELAAIERHGVTLLALEDPAYPKLLRHIPDPPRLLWVRGELRDTDALSLAMVGARRCSHYGREQAERFASQAAQAGLCIVSGGAYGIDVAAHRGALKTAGRTIAVLGSGLADPYPKEHVKLFGEIVNKTKPRGAVVSELPMHSPPIAENFPRRNRIISGLALGTLVVEAAARSGALITARLCVEEHGREAMALPGRVDSQASAGCHKMIREGWATLVTNIADVLDALGEAGQTLKAEVTVDGGAGPTTTTVLEQGLTDAQRKIMDAASEPRSLDQLTAFSGLPVHRVQAEVTLLEIRGALRRSSGLFVRRK